VKLEDLIAKDFELQGHGNYLKGVEHDSLVVDLRKQLWFYNSKGLSGDIFTWLTQMKGMTEKEAQQYIKINDRDHAYSFIHNFKDEKETVVYPKLVDIFFEDSVLNSRKYWYDRGINDTTIQRFKLGYYEGWGMIPIFQDGLFRNFQMRRDDPKKMIKHYYRGVGRNLLNADILRIVDTVFITEGPTDCLRLSQEGVPVVSHNAGAGGWDNEWCKYFITQKNVWYIGDNDSAGRDGARRVAESLGTMKVKIYTFDGYDEKADVVDFFRNGGTKDQLIDIVYTKSKYLFELQEGVKKNSVYRRR
jgi:twinkle protein